MGSNEKNGPKGRCFFLFHLLLILIFFCLSRFYSHYKTTGRIRLGHDEENGPKRHVLRRLGQRYVFFLSLSHFTQSNYFFLLYLGAIHLLRQWGGSGWVLMKKTGPNDCLGQGKCFFFFLLNLINFFWFT